MGSKEERPVNILIKEHPSILYKRFSGRDAKPVALLNAGRVGVGQEYLYQIGIVEVTFTISLFCFVPPLYFLCIR